VSKLSKIERNQYVQSMLRELRDMTAGGRNEFLTYLIEMAYLEASDQVRADYAQTAGTENLSQVA
jgi:hypothetical protein